MDRGSGYDSDFPSAKDIKDSMSTIFKIDLKNTFAKGMRLSQQAQKTKRLIENEALAGIDSKEKAFQFRKIIREFLVWIHKSKAVTISDIQFWEWIKSINAENSHKDRDFKATCADFIEKLLSNHQFRVIMQVWMTEYEKTLDDGEENMKTKVILEYIKQRIRKDTQSTVNNKKRCIELQAAPERRDCEIQTEVSDEAEQSIDELNKELESKTTILTLMKKNFRDQEKMIETLKKKIESIAGKTYESDS
ncbi:unnamed protein product [Blepharisma stoltei]|uniref:Uncharacterized protein n=1 Tax=Blepharisma stoltei TaxID=1481888 RepID=A0AAU9II96_9CILI|nr:unnamed protein product [Blepharisma stoltei]